MLLTLLALMAEGSALAGAGWFLQGPDVELEEVADIPLYRGDLGEYRPVVHVGFGEEHAASGTLAVVDLGGEWTRIGADLAARLDLKVKTTAIHGKTVRRAVIDEVILGDLTLRGLRAQVIPGGELILGFGNAGQVGVGLLPSLGVVRFAPPSEIEALLRVAGGSLPAFGQDTSRWMEHGEPRYGNGLSLAAPVLVDGKPGGAWIRTDWARSRLSAGGESVELADFSVGVRAIIDDSLADPADDFLGGLGYDVLYAYDIVLSPAEDLMAIQLAEDPKWEDPAPIAVAAAKLRHEMWKAATEASASGNTARPQIGFEADTRTSTISGDPGDLSAVRQHTALSDALWMGGDPEGAVVASLAATRAAGDRCEPFQTLGTRRMQTSGALQKQSFVAKLVSDPLKRADDLWHAWASLTPEEREAARAGKDLGDTTFQLPQPGVCEEALGQYWLALVSHGKGADVLEQKKRRAAEGRHTLAGGLAALASGDAAASEASIRGAIRHGAIASGPLPARFAWAAARAAQNKPLPTLTVDPDRSDALLLALAARVLGPVEASSSIADALAAAIHEEGTTEGLAERIEEARKRRAGAPEVACQLAVLHAITGNPEAAATALQEARSDRHRVPDYWLASYIVAIAQWELEDARAALDELQMRFPALPSEIAR